MKRLVEDLRKEIPALTKAWADAVRSEAGLSHLSQEAQRQEFLDRAAETVQLALSTLNAERKVARDELERVGVEAATTLGFVTDIPIEEVVTGLNLLRITVWSRLEERIRTHGLSPEQTFLVAHNLSNIMNAVSNAIATEYVSLHRRREAEQRRRERELLVRDPTTGIYNMRHFNQVLDREIDRSNRHKRPLGLLMIDCDDLKPINDTYGHVHGDRLIMKIVRMLKRGLRKYDVLARYGGDEFIVLLPETDKGTAAIIADRLRQGAEDLVFTVGLNPIPISVSIGVAAAPDDTEDASELTLFADNAMYAAKRAGKNQIAEYGPDSRVLSE